MENAINEIGKGLEEVKKTISGGSEKKEEAANAEGEEKKEEKAEKGEEDEGKTVENCKPSQALVGAFATALNMDFGTKTPSHKTLAALSGISETDPIKIIAAVNAKFAELTAAGNKTAKNTSAVGNVFGVVLNGEV